MPQIRKKMEIGPTNHCFSVSTRIPARPVGPYGTSWGSNHTCGKPEWTSAVLLIQCWLPAKRMWSQKNWNPYPVGANTHQIILTAQKLKHTSQVLGWMALGHISLRIRNDTLHKIRSLLIHSLLLHNWMTSSATRTRVAVKGSNHQRNLFVEDGFVAFRAICWTGTILSKCKRRNTCNLILATESSEWLAESWTRDYNCSETSDRLWAFGIMLRVGYKCCTRVYWSAVSLTV